METRIPSKLHFIFLNKDETIPHEFMECYERAKQIHPAWEVKIYNEDDAQAILSKHLPALLPIYNGYAHVVQKSDILRIVLVYLFGGFYMDLDMFSLKNLEELQNHEVVLGKERILSDDELNHFEAKHRLRIGNYMFGGVSGHPFWLSFLKEGIKYAQQKVDYENDIIKTTGPELLTNVYHSCKKKYRNITVLGNIDRRCLTVWHDAISCHFGNYASHLHTGTWRWKGKKSSVIVKQAISVKDYRKALSSINALLNGADVVQDEFVVLDTSFRHLCMYENLWHLYVKLIAVYPKVNDSKNLVDKIVVAFGSPLVHEDRLNMNNRNILYTIVDEDHLTENWIASLNNFFHCCIVPHEYFKQKLIANGVTIPIVVIALGFERRLRNFITNEDDQITDFTVAFPLTGSGQNVDAVISACRLIRERNIPELKLKLMVDSNYNKPGSALKDQIRRMGYIEIVDISKMYARKFDNIHCFIFCDHRSHWSLGPREVLYEGIPAILISSPVYDELIKSGFYCVIELEQQQQQNNDGILTSRIKKGILKMYNNYTHYNTCALEGSRWIEDRWTQEYTMLEIYRMLKRITSLWRKETYNINC